MLKKIFITALFFYLPLSFSGFVGNNFISIDKAKKLKDDTWVEIKGNIVSRVDEDQYIFSDGKTKILIEVENNVWLGRKITPKRSVIVYGEIEKDFLEKTTIEVRRIEIL